MTQNDFLQSFYQLPPLLIAPIIWLWGFGSLLFLGWRTKSIKSVVLKSPGMIIGDFFIIPAIAALIPLAYQLVDNPLPATTSSEWNIAILLIAFLLTIISLTRFKNWYVWFMPHGVFYFFFAYYLLNFLTKGVYQILFGTTGETFKLLWGLISLGIIAHEWLGFIKPKKFPKPK